MPKTRSCIILVFYAKENLVKIIRHITVCKNIMKYHRIILLKVVEGYAMPYFTQRNIGIFKFFSYYKITIYMDHILYDGVFVYLPMNLLIVDVL